MKKIIFKSKPIVCLTAYNKFYAEIADNYCDLILVGDSMGMAYYGNSSTRSVTIHDIIRHGKSVRQGIKKSIMVVDMPFGTYKTKKIAYENARKIIKETRCDAIKLEGGTEIKNIIRYLNKKKINVMGHIGILPQKISTRKGFKVLGKTEIEQKKIIKDFENLENTGIFSIVIEGVTVNLANKIASKSKIPIIGIGATNKCDGQILVLEDMLGFFDKVPKFVKKYSNIKSIIKKAVKIYSREVKKKKFPTKKHMYN